MRNRSCTIFILLIFCFLPVYATNWKAQHVILIGLDGWGSYSVEKANMPNIKQLMKDGSYTLAKRSVLPSSSAVNWASMFMGAGPELHGYTEWGTKTPDLPSRVLTHYGLFPSIFGLLRDNAPKAEIGYIYEWDGMKYLAENKAMSYEQNIPATKENSTGCLNAAIKYIKEKKPNLLGVIFDEPDGVGHREGHNTEAYYDKLTLLDDYVGRIIKAAKEAGIFQNTIFIVTADHGGINKGHGGKSMSEMETPFIISGKGIKKGVRFEESMMQFDVASTIAQIFNLTQPQVWIGRPMKQVFK